MRRLLALALLVGWAGGCSAGFDPSSYLKPGQLRVLGVVVQPVDASSSDGAVAEVAAGQSARLTVIAPPMSDGTPIFYDWAVCTKPPPPGTAEVDDDCLKQNTASFLIPIPGNGPSAIITMPANASQATLGVPDISDGLYLPVRIRAFAGGQRLDTIYGLRLATGLEPTNHNPTIDHAELVDAPLDASPMNVTELSTDPAHPTPLTAGSEPVLRLLLTGDSYETFIEPTGTPPNITLSTVTEEPRFLWYASAGDLSEDTTGMAQPDTKLRLDKARAPSPGDKVDLWVVVHDDRSGTAFTHRYLVVQ